MQRRGIQTYLISEADEQSAERRAQLGRVFGHVKRVDPVFTRDSCVGTPAETGVFRAHKSAWEACAKGDAEQCLVLERDWSLGRQKEEDVAQTLRGLEIDKDYYQLGHCYGNLCMHAYVISKDLAGSLSSADECEVGTPVDYFLEQQTQSESESGSLVERALNFLRGRETQGTWTRGRYEQGEQEGFFGEGLIVQNRDVFQGMHNKDDSFNHSAYSV